MIKYLNMLDFLFVQRGNRSFECFISLMHNIFFVYSSTKLLGESCAQQLMWPLQKVDVKLW